MIAANGVTARFLDARGFPSLRRVVKSPERWDRIRELAEETGDELPPEADSAALAAFLARRRAATRTRFPISRRSIIQLLGSGEYVVDPPGAEPPGHFGLAVRDYTHSTAPNRRYPDLVTQRLLKAALAGRPSPYGLGELEQLAEHCTRQEDAANKVERQVRKSAAALIVESRIGETFDGVRHRRVEQGDMGARDRAADRREAAARRARPRRRRPCAGAARGRQRRARLHRLRDGREASADVL